MSRLLRLAPDFQPSFDGLKISRQLVEKVIEKLPLKEAFLFGSSAEGKNTSNSDLDILLVVPDEQDVKSYYSLVGTKHFSPVAVDWIVKNDSVFQTQMSEGGISRVAVLTGVRIFPHEPE